MRCSAGFDETLVQIGHTGNDLSNIQVESRLLNREVLLTFSGVDKFGNARRPLADFATSVA